MMKMSWLFYYDLLKMYYDEYNSFPVCSLVYKGVKLGSWVSRVRSTYNNGVILEDGSVKYRTNRLTKEQIDLLKKIGFPFVSTTYDDNFDRNLGLLVEYRDKHNGRYPNPNDDLFVWVNTQRMTYNLGEKRSDESFYYNGNILTKKRLEKLKSIGFSFESTTYDDSFDEYFEVFMDYLDKYNSKYPEHGEVYRGLNIGNWVMTVRAVYLNGKISEDGSIKYNGRILTKKQIDKLKSINFIWFVNESRIYERIIDTDGKMEGSRRILLDKLDIVLDRGILDKGLINEELIILLDDGKCFIKKRRYEQWNEKYSLLETYLRENNYVYPPSNLVYKGVKLGSWVLRQKIIYNNGLEMSDGSFRYNGKILTKEQIDKLKGINFPFEYALRQKLYDDKWNKYYDLLVMYLNEFNGSFPHFDEWYHEVRIGHWVNLQRTILLNGLEYLDGSIRYGANVLTKRQVDKLKSINFPLVFDEERFYKKTIKGEKDYLKTKKYLLNILLNMNCDVSLVNQEFMKLLNVRK